MGRLIDSFKAYITDDATAIDADILAGKTAYVNGGKVTGTAGAAAVHYVGGTRAAYSGMVSSPTTYTIDTPDDIQAGDLLIWVVGTRNSFLATLPTGFTSVTYSGVAISSLETPPSTVNDCLRIMWKFATGSEGATIGIESTDDGDDYIGMSMCAFRNVGQDPEFSAVTGGTGVSPSVTGVANGMLVSIFGSIFEGNQMLTQNLPANAGNQLMPLVNYEYNVTSDIGICFGAEALLVSGATGTRTWGSWASYEYVCSVLLKP